jgi:hypothetical protein
MSTLIQRAPMAANMQITTTTTTTTATIAFLNAPIARYSNGKKKRNVSETESPSVFRRTKRHTDFVGPFRKK